MRVDKVKLINFLSHDETTVTFKGDINVIIGHNGAGKSSIIDAINFALFKATRGKIDDMVKRGKASALVELELKMGNSLVKIQRSIPSRKELLFINDKLIARSAKEVNKKVEELGLDSRVVLTTMIVRQGEIENIFENLSDILKKKS